jgi:hypothetical protein
VSEAKCKRCKELEAIAYNQAVGHLAALNAILARSGMDLCPCRVCDEPVICIPDGLALCKDCAEKAGE